MGDLILGEEYDNTRNIDLRVWYSPLQVLLDISTFWQQMLHPWYRLLAAAFAHWRRWPSSAAAHTSSTSVGGTKPGARTRTRRTDVRVGTRSLGLTRSVRHISDELCVNRLVAKKGTSAGTVRIIGRSASRRSSSTSTYLLPLSKSLTCCHWLTLKSQSFFTGTMSAAMMTDGH